MLGLEATHVDAKVLSMLICAAFWWPVCQEVTAVELVMRDKPIREPMRDIVAMKWLVPVGCSEPLRAAALVIRAR
eukprot:8321588-Pyramimonas_sp.AAC.1